MLPVGAAWGFRDEAELRASGAAVVIRRPAELLEVIEGRS
jgi:phosphoglycolate phosphatase-like HAD superfamily hydrolase